MRQWFSQLDRVLRGGAVAPGGREVAVPAGGLAGVNVLLAAVYGVCMGFFAVFNRDAPEFRQAFASAVKVPLLFFLTLLVTFPSLYVFNALFGSRLSFGSLLRLMMAALGVTTAVLASIGPVVAFFSVTTTSYPFILLLNVAVFALSGAFGMASLLSSLERLTAAARRPAGEGEEDTAPPPAADGGVRGVFACWIAMFGVVGAQMGWVLRPFVGTPDQPFAWFRPRSSSFFESVLHTLRRLFGE